MAHIDQRQLDRCPLSYMGKGQIGDHPVTADQVVYIDQLGANYGKIAEAVHYTFGGSGRARGIDDGRHRILIGICRVGQRLMTRNQILPAGEALTSVIRSQ